MNIDNQKVVNDVMCEYTVVAYRIIWETRLRKWLLGQAGMFRFFDK